MAKNSSIQVKPLVGAFGVEIVGVDKQGKLTDDQRNELQRIINEHHLVVIRNLDLTPAEQAEFGNHFGELATYPFVESIPEHPQIIPVIKEADDEMNFGGAWHTDMVYTREPPALTMLYAVEIPPVGGDTLFSNAIAAYDDFSESYKSLLAGLAVEYDASLIHSGNRATYSTSNKVSAKEDPEILAQRVSHPLVRRHPHNGKNALYLSAAHTRNFQGMTPEESAPVLNFLHNHLISSEYSSRVHWQLGTFTIWDNRCVLHYALNDYPGYRREMRRLTTKGEKPLAAQCL